MIRKLMADEGFGAWLDEARALIALAAPLTLTQLAQMAIGTTDIVLLGWYSQSALAAAAVGNTLYFFAWMFISGPGNAVSPMVAQAVGAREAHKAEVRGALRMGIWAVVVSSLPFMVLLMVAEPLLRLLHQTPQVAHDAGIFCRIVAMGLPFAMMSGVLRNFATALERPYVGLVVSLTTILFNGLVGWTLIFGHFGAPRLGIAGSATGTALSSVFSLTLALGLITADPKLRAYRGFKRFTLPVRAKLSEIFRLGIPMSFTMTFEGMLFNAMTLVMGTFGAAPLAAHQIAMNVCSVTFMVPLGIGMGSGIRVGLAAGAGDIARARRAAMTAMVLGEIFMASFGLIMFFNGAPIASLYGKGAAGASLALAVLYLKYGAAFQVFDCQQVIAAQSLRGLKDATWPMIIAGASYWVIGAPVGFILAYAAGWTGQGVWTGFVVSLMVAAVAMSMRFFRLTRA